MPQTGWLSTEVCPLVAREAGSPNPGVGRAVLSAKALEKGPPWALRSRWFPRWPASWLADASLGLHTVFLLCVSLFKFVSFFMNPPVIGVGLTPMQCDLTLTG